ncbi:MAG: hypothetical protein WBD81_15645 [Collimonas pratensis]|uniref:hypothetical protein n=1 Tax=Collimonas pratensis TaxID=279113 RepID=UPI003C76A817
MQAVIAQALGLKAIEAFPGLENFQNHALFGWRGSGFLLVAHIKLLAEGGREYHRLSKRLRVRTI